MKTSAPVFWSIHHMSRVSAAFITIITHLPEISLQPEVISILFFQIAWFGPNILQPNNILKKYLKSSHLDAPLTSKLHQEALIFPRCYATSATRINKLHNSVIRSDDAGPALTVQTHSAVHRRRLSTARHPRGDLTSRRLQPMRREKRLPLSAAETPGRKWFINKVCQMIKINIMSRLVTYVPVTPCEDWNHDCAFYYDESHQRVASSPILTNSLLRKQHI